MTLMQYEVFLSVAEKGSFTKAGETLNLSQSAVSHAISSLEAELKVSLLHRNRSGVTLTDAGQQLICHIREILNHTELIKQKAGKINGVEIGKIRIGSFPSASAELLPGMIKLFKDKHPGVNVEIIDGSYQDICKYISKGFVDIGFVILPNDNFYTIPVLDDEYVVVLPEGHFLEGNHFIHIKDISAEPFILPLAGCESYIKPLFKEFNIKPNIQFEIESTSTVIAMVRAGLGISIVPKLAYKPIGVTSVRLVPRIQRKIGLGLRSLQMTSPATKSFIKHIS